MQHHFNGFSVNLHDSNQHFEWDKKIITEIWHQDTYKLTPIKEEIRLIFDIGAHVGLFTLYAQQKWPLSHVVCFEPCQENFSILLSNASTSNVIKVNVGVSDYDGFSRLQTYKHTGSRNTGGNKIGTLGDEVKLINITTAIKNFGCPDLIKIDCEGPEKEILIALKRHNLLNKIRFIRGESHHRNNIWLHETLEATHKLEIKQGRRLAIFSADLICQ